jgi:hypothetical protein
MATHKGSEGIVKVGSSNVVAEIRSYSIEESADTLEDTSMGDSAKTYKASLTSFSGSLDVFWDETDTIWSRCFKHWGRSNFKFLS